MCACEGMLACMVLKILIRECYVTVERGLVELRKLGVETKLWEEPRRLIDQDSIQKTLLETEFQMLA